MEGSHTWSELIHERSWCMEGSDTWNALVHGGR